MTEFAGFSAPEIVERLDRYIAVLDRALAPEATAEECRAAIAGVLTIDCRPEVN